MIFRGCELLEILWKKMYISVHLSLWETVHSFMKFQKRFMKIYYRPLLVSSQINEERLFHPFHFIHAKLRDPGNNNTNFCIMKQGKKGG